MKKGFIVLSLLLVVFQSISCDNTDRVFEVYSEFTSSYSVKGAVDDLMFDILQSHTWSGGKVDYRIEKTSDFLPLKVARLYEKCSPPGSGREYKGLVITEVKGSIGGKYSGRDNYSIVTDGVRIAFTYDIADDSTGEIIEEGRTGVLEISTKVSTEEKDGLRRERTEVAVNRKTFSLFLLVDEKNGVLKEAVINSKKVDVRFINAFFNLFR